MIRSTQAQRLHILFRACLVSLLWIASSAFRSPPTGRWSSFAINGEGGNPASDSLYWNLELRTSECEYPRLDIDGLSRMRGGKDKGESSSRILEVLTNFWNLTFSNAVSSIRGKFSKKTDNQKELLDQLKSQPIRAVSVPNTTVLPDDVIRVAVKRSGLIGSPLETGRVQEIANTLKRWYIRNGYVLHSVTGANLKVDSSVAEIAVEEPKVSIKPIDITLLKEMVVDEGGELLTFRQYAEKHAARKSFRHDRIEKKDLNTTYIETAGRTKPSKIGGAMNLIAGKPFRWDSTRWKKVASSGIFSNVLRVAPQRMKDGTVQMQIFATEPPPRHLEYGLGKSLYSGSWEGEIDFEHQNLFGGGEVVGLMVRRGTKDIEPSIKLRYTDDHFGLEGGFECEIFSDFLGDSESADEKENHGEDLCFRKGFGIRIHNPVNTDFIRNSVSSISIERASSKGGTYEDIGSSTFTIGPFRSMLPFDARTSLVTSLTGGLRMGRQGNDNDIILPYTSGSATARQILPLSTSKLGGKMPVLALQHTIAKASKNFPRYEAKAMGVSSQIRGCVPEASASSSIKGTAEVRLPLQAPFLGNSAVVLFGDWYRVQNVPAGRFGGKSSIGIGFRKMFQGLPLKYDVCYTSDRRIKTMFGLGPDFDV